MKSFAKIFLFSAIFVLSFIVSTDFTFAQCGGITDRDECQDSCSANNFECTWRSVSQRCNESAIPCGQGGGGGTGPGGPPGDDILMRDCTTTDIRNGYFSCRGGSNCSFCMKSTTRTCNQVIPEVCSGGGIGSCSSITGAVNTYYCQGAPLPNQQGCQRNDPLPAGVRWNTNTHTIVGSFCGTVQVDATNGSGLCSLYDTSGCGGTGGASPVSTPIPVTPAPAPVAQCVNIKIYTPSWTQIDANTFFNLTQRSQVYFCVAGSTTSGAFTKARFTINNTLRPETTLRRPNTNDFCDLYTIPSNTYNFAIQGEVYHQTLGWR